MLQGPCANSSQHLPRPSILREGYRLEKDFGMSWLTRVRNSLSFAPKRDTPDNLWIKCPSCSEMLFTKEYEDNLSVCPRCDHHGRIGATARLAEEGADWVTFTSSSTVEHFHARFDLPKLVKQFPQLKLASIGPETSKAIVALGLKPTLEAKEHTTDGLIAALLKAAK